MLATYTPSAACIAAQAFLQAVLDDNDRHPNPCPDVALEVTESFNACDFATTPLELADIVQSVAMFACMPSDPMGWTLGARYEYANGCELACVYVDGARAVVWDMEDGGYHVAHGFEDSDLWNWTLEPDENTTFQTFPEAFAALTGD